MPEPAPIKPGGSGLALLSLASKIIIDPDHIIQRRLDINLKVLGANAAEAELYRINYIVYLEEVTLSANEAIISNIKSVAQDVDN